MNSSWTQGELCYIPQGVRLYQVDAHGSPIDFFNVEKPTTAVVFGREPTFLSLQVLVHGQKWQVLKSDIYPMEVPDAY